MNDERPGFSDMFRPRGRELDNNSDYVEDRRFWGVLWEDFRYNPGQNWREMSKLEKCIYGPLAIGLASGTIYLYSKMFIEYFK